MIAAMKMLFVTGSNAAFFNSLLICLQSFSERLPGQRLLVCDFGLTPAQAQFLQHLGLLLPRPPALAGLGVFQCKAALLAYLRHGGHPIGDDDAVVWLDADLTLMQVGIADFESVIGAMTSAGADVAVCAEPTGRSLGEMAAIFSDAAKMAPFARMIATTGLSPALPYVSTGLLFCRAPAVLERWMKLTLAVAEHPLFEQNMFNVVLHQNRIPHLALDCEEWQAYGASLDKIHLAQAEPGARPAARIGSKNIKTLHTSSPQPGHLLIAACRMTVRDVELTGPFKLFLAEALRLHQLQLLAGFIVEHREALLGFRICTRAAAPIEGFQFVTL